MNRRLALIVAIIALASARRAAAQDVAIGYQGLPYKVQKDAKTGINIAEGMLLHLGLGAEAGYDSNVFYSNSGAPGGVVGSPIFRFNTFAEITNASRMGGLNGSGGGVSYDVRAGLTYRRYTAPEVAAYRDAFMPSAGVSIGSTVGTLSLQLTDAFLRQEDPPYQGATVRSTPITRDNNVAALQGQWSPGGGRISGTLRYTNTIDAFENDTYAYANSVSHQLMLDVSWKWLPKTALFIQATQGYITYLEDSCPPMPAANQKCTKKVSSFPLHVYAGLRGLITPKLTAMAALGYANAFYSSGVNTGGFLGSSYVDLQAVYTPTILNRVTVGYHQDFVNSVISNFYYDYSGYLSYVQQLAGRVSVDISGRFSHLDYQGQLFDTQPRTDNVVTAGATIDYFLRSWAYMGVGYSVTSDLTDYVLPGTTAPVSYTKHQVFARLGVTY